MKILALVLAAVFILLAVLAATGSTSFMPVLGLDGTHHVKHAILYAILAILSLVWFRFASASVPIASR